MNDRRPLLVALKRREEGREGGRTVPVSPAPADQPPPTALPPLSGGLGHCVAAKKLVALSAAAYQ